MAARYQHLSPTFLSDAVKFIDGAYAEQVGDTEATNDADDSGSIVTVALPATSNAEG